MNLAHEAIQDSSDATEAYVYATMNAKKGDVVQYFDVYKAPHFVFKDGSALEFIVNYDREISSVMPFDSVEELMKQQHLWNVERT